MSLQQNGTKNCYFMIKSDSSNEASFWEFIENVNKELIFRLNKNTYDKRTIVVYDNPAIHKTKKVKPLVKKIKMNSIYNPSLFARIKSNWTYIWHI